MNSKWLDAKNLLCIRLDAMGDLLMTTPAIQKLKEAVPGRRINLLTSPQGARIAKSIPLFDDVMTYEAPWLKASTSRNDPNYDFSMIEKLKKGKYDGAVIYTVYSQNPLPSALICYLAEIPLRAAYCRENPYQLLTDWIKEDEPDKLIRHETARHLNLVKSLGASIENVPLTLKVSENASASIQARLKKFELDLSAKDWVIIHPGSTAESRRYHTDGFARVADLLIKESGKKIIFTGGTEEVSLITEIQQKMREKSSSYNWGGLFSLEELIALIDKTHLLISNNSGPVHMAAALGIPVVVLYALTNPQHTPWMVPHHVLYEEVDCKFCYKSLCPKGTNQCLNGIDPSKIHEKAIDLISRVTPSTFDPRAVEPLTMKI